MTAMSKIRATAEAHIERDQAMGRRWSCECDDCREFRSLVGVDKLLEVRPLVREIDALEDRLREADGTAAVEILQEHSAAYDKLADTMAK